MGTTTNGQICYGLVFEEDHEFPWDMEDFDDGIDDWWKKVKGYKPPHEIYDEHGEYKDGVKPEESVFREYYDHRYDWEKKNPLPIKLVNYCSLDCPMYILAVPNSLITANRGYPTTLSKKEFELSHNEIQGLIDFCHEYNIECDISEITWHLSSFWG